MTDYALMAPSQQKYFTSDGHWMAIGQNGFLYNTIQHSHTSDVKGWRLDLDRIESATLTAKICNTT